MSRSYEENQTAKTAHETNAQRKTHPVPPGQGKKALLKAENEELKAKNDELEADLETAQKNIKTVAMETRAECALEFAKAAVGRPNQKLYVCIEGGCLTAVVGPSEMDFDVETLDMDNAESDEDEELRVGELENEMNDLMESGEYHDYTACEYGEEE